MLQISYDPALVLASVLVAIMASYTGLRLASDLSRFDMAVRKRAIARAAIALGGGIWSMHFVGMLAVRIPVAIRYDALATLGSMLVAILFVGFSLLLLHFGHRNKLRIALAGTLSGLGIMAMHYTGMSAIGGNCIVSYEPSGFITSSAIAIGASVAAFWLAYAKRTHLQIALGSVVFGITIASMHYSAMIFTRFSIVTEITLIEEPNLSSGALALVVAFAAFLICGLFLLTAIPTASEEEAAAKAGAAAQALPAHAPAVNGHAGMNGNDGAAKATFARLPYEINHSTRFISVDDIYVVRADGHYTRLYAAEREVFCPWPISRVETELNDKIFIRTHRSYLVNLKHVRGFERAGDKAFCIVDDVSDDRIPVSRSRVHDVRKALGLD